MDRRTKDWRSSSEIASSIRGKMSGGDPLENAKIAYEAAERCGVCGTSARTRPLGEQLLRLIDEMLLDGSSYPDVLAGIEPLVAVRPESERPTYWQIMRHAKRHLQADARIVRAIVEAEAIKQGRDLEQDETPLVTPSGFFRLIQQRTFESLARGEVEPTVREGLDASRLLDASTAEDLRARLAQANANIRLLMRLLEEIASREQVEAAYSKLEQGHNLPKASRSAALARQSTTTEKGSTARARVAEVDAGPPEVRVIDSRESASVNGHRTGQTA